MDNMRLRGLLGLVIVLLIFLTACANTSQQEGQPQEEAAPFAITLENANDAFHHPERIAVGARYGAYAYTSEEQFEQLRELLDESDLAAFEPVDAEETTQDWSFTYADLLIDQGERDFILQIMDALDDEDSCYIRINNHLGFNATQEEFLKQMEELNSLPIGEKSLVLRGPRSNLAELDAFKEIGDRTLLDKSDPENCAEVTVLAESAAANSKLLAAQDSFIMNKSKSAVIKYYFDRGAMSTPAEPAPEANYDLRIKMGGTIYLFDTSTGAYNINDEGLFVLDTPLETFLRNVAP